MNTGIQVLKSTYKVIPEQKIVICILECSVGLTKTDVWHSSDWYWWRKRLPLVNYEGHFTVKAKARCNENDTFDEVIGKRIAESRAKAKAYRTNAKFWDICERKLDNLRKICKTINACSSIAYAREQEHIKELIN